MHGEMANLTISKELFKSWIYEDCLLGGCFTKLLNIVLDEDREEFVGGRIEVRRRGTVMASVTDMATYWGVTRKTAARLLTTLENGGAIRRSEGELEVVEYDRWTCGDAGRLSDACMEILNFVSTKYPRCGQNLPTHAKNGTLGTKYPSSEEILPTNDTKKAENAEEVSKIYPSDENLNVKEEDKNEGKVSTKYSTCEENLPIGGENPPQPHARAHDSYITTSSYISSSSYNTRTCARGEEGKPALGSNDPPLSAFGVYPPNNFAPRVAGTVTDRLNFFLDDMTYAPFILLRSKMSKDEAREYIPEFVAQLNVEKSPDDENDTKLANHFGNWLQKKKDYNERQRINGTNINNRQAADEARKQHTNEIINRMLAEVAADPKAMGRPL